MAYKQEENTDDRVPGTTGITDHRFAGHRAIPLKIVLIYLVLGGLWILLSDRLLALFVTDPAAITRLQTIKGWLFVLVTAGLLYGIITYYLAVIRRAVATLRESERYYRTMIEHMSEGMTLYEVIYDDQHQPIDLRILDVNPAFESLLGIERGHAVGMRASQVFGPEQIPDLTIFANVAQSGTPTTFETYYKPVNRHFLAAAFAPTPGKCAVVVTDITQLKRNEEQLKRINRTLKLLSQTNRTLVHAHSELGLLQTICQVMVDVGGFRMAWVGYAQQNTEHTVEPMAFAGEEQGYLSTVHFSWADTPLGRGPVGVAIRTGKITTAFDVRTDPRFAPWHEEAIQRGYVSVVALPLIINDQPLGTIVLYTGEPYTLDAEESELLDELASDVGYGITALRTRAALRKGEEQYRNIVETAQEGIWVFDNNFITTYVNQRAAELFGYREDDMIGRSLFDFIPPDQQTELEHHLNERRQGKREVYRLRFRRRTGEDIWAIVSASPLFDEHGKFAGSFAMLTDITEQQKTFEFQREFTRKTIEAATEGKLRICDRDEILHTAGPPIATWIITHIEEIGDIRQAVTDIATANGMEEDRVFDFVICLSEAMTNAFKHAGGGTVSLHRLKEALFAVIDDHGPGIPAVNLPELALKRGYTTATSLGMGYKTMISLADRICLATGPDGTMVGIEMYLHTQPAKPQEFPGVTEVW
ncbi:MAG TPA: PAS domain S-box protein [Armatimonadota bacterium]|nr:PAS domain S-box protein [Armatimonadota bacterium]